MAEECVCPQQPPEASESQSIFRLHCKSNVTLCIEKLTFLNWNTGFSVYTLPFSFSPLLSLVSDTNVSFDSSSKK